MAADRQIPTSASAPPVSGPTFMDAVQEELTALFNAALLPLSNYGGTTNAPTADVTPALTGGLENGMGFLFVAQATNTGILGVTLNIGGVGAKDIVDRHGNALLAGMLKLGGTYPLIYSSATGKLVAVTLERGLIGRQRMNFSVAKGEIQTRTTNGAASGTGETTTNKVMRRTLDFDASTQEYAQVQFSLPKRWDEGSLRAVFIWSHAATTINFGVRWGIQGLALGNDDAMDAAFGTGVEVTDTGGTTDDIYISDETADFTLSGSPQEGDLITLQIYRAAANAADTLAIDARLHAIDLIWTANASEEPA